MYKKIHLLFLFLLSVNLSFSQVEKLNKWSETNPIEKLYLHFDRDNYLVGQTMWFRAYFYSEYNLDDKNSTLYVELLDENSVIRLRKVFPVYNGFAKGQVELPDSMEGGNYIIRAYSPRMLNHESDFLYKKGFVVTGKTKASIAGKPSVAGLKLQFFPEGGNFINGYLNTIAFKATDANGYPVSVEGTIKNSAGETITEFQSWHDGMGSVEIMAEPNAGYYAVLSNDPGKRFELPSSSDKGVALHIQASDKKLFFELFQQDDDPMFAPSLVVGQSQHKLIFKQPIQRTGQSTTGAISSVDIPSGILEITVLNSSGMPLASRLCFIDNGEYIQPAELLTDTLSFKQREKNKFSLAFKDTVSGSFSMSITDAGLDPTATRSENIYSRLLLTSDLRGYIHHPAWYFKAGNDSADKAMDLLMMTNGWSRFKWTNLNALPLPRYKDPGYISLSGKVNVFGRERTINNKDFLLFISSGDSTRSMEMTTTNDRGEFKADSLVFYEKSVIMFSDLQNKKTKLDINLFGGDSLLRQYALPAVKKNDVFPVPAGVAPRDLLNEKLWAEYEAMMKAEGLTLSMVTVKTKKKSDLQQLEERYVSNIFSSNAEKTIDFTNNNDLTGYRNVLDYLQSRVPGLNVVRTGMDYMLYYRNRRTLMGGPIPMVVFLDEIRTDANMVSFIPGYQVAMVKIFSNFVGADGNASGGAIAVYTKKGDDLFNSLPTDCAQVRYRGYSLIREFYSPDYSGPDKNSVAADTRMTLHWNPDIFVNGVNEKIPFVFYNNDNCKSYRVVVEGITADGKLLMIEKIIAPKAF